MWNGHIEPVQGDLGVISSKQSRQKIDHQPAASCFSKAIETKVESVQPLGTVRFDSKLALQQPIDERPIKDGSATSQPLPRLPTSLSAGFVEQGIECHEGLLVHLDIGPLEEAEQRE